MADDNIVAVCEKIAKVHLGIDTLRPQDKDSLDFHSLSVWSIQSALVAAYVAGQLDEREAFSRMSIGQFTRWRDGSNDRGEY